MTLDGWNDGQFLAIVRLYHDIGYGRMMQIVSEEWHRIHGDSALTVGDAYAVVKRKQLRCKQEGHDWHEGGEYFWCDRCGINRSKDRVRRERAKKRRD